MLSQIRLGAANWHGSRQNGAREFMSCRQTEMPEKRKPS